MKHPTFLVYSTEPTGSVVKVKKTMVNCKDTEVSIYDS